MRPVRTQRDRHDNRYALTADDYNVYLPLNMRGAGNKNGASRLRFICGHALALRGFTQSKDPNTTPCPPMRE